MSVDFLLGFIGYSQMLPHICLACFTFYVFKFAKSKMPCPKRIVEGNAALFSYCIYVY